jgi:uncharacterized membrane protein HdeD (DUF308 family)
VTRPRAVVADDARVTTTSAAQLSDAEHAAVEGMARWWWLKLVAAACWLLLSVIVFRFDWTTVSAISVLFGVVMIGAAISESIAAVVSHGWWRIGFALLALACLVIGIVAFAHPGNTFAALAGVMSFYFIFKGGMTIAVATGMGGFGFSWLTLLVGLAQLLLGFWAAGYFGHRAILLVVWVGAVALTRAVTDTFEAFALRRIRA